MGLLRFLLFETYLINQRSPYVEHTVGSKGELVQWRYRVTRLL